MLEESRSTLCAGEPLNRVNSKDLVRPMRGLGSIETGQRLLEGVELARSVYRGHIDCGQGQVPDGFMHERARRAVTVFERLAKGLRS